MNHTKKVLVVDDDPRLAELMMDFCSEMGLEARSVTDSRVALLAALSFQPDLITLDLEMPHKDGLQLLQEFRERPEFARTPILIISALVGEVRTKDESVQGIFPKPLNFRIFTRKLGALLGQMAA